MNLKKDTNITTFEPRLGSPMAMSCIGQILRYPGLLILVYLSGVGWLGGYIIQLSKCVLSQLHINELSELGAIY